MADKVSYLGRDLEDAIRAGLVDEGQVPESIKQKLGRKNGEIIDTLVKDIITQTQRTGRISLSEENHQLMQALYDFNMTHIYTSPPLEEYGLFSEKILRTLFEELSGVYDRYGDDHERYDQDPVPLFRRFGRHLDKYHKIYVQEKTSKAVIVGDYISGMTDDYALKCIHEVFIPEPLKFDIPRGMHEA